MPLYSYKCKVCGKEDTAYRSISARHNGPTCHEKMELVIVPTMLNPVLGGGALDGYKCPVTGEFVTSRKRRKEIIKENNLVEKG